MCGKLMVLLKLQLEEVRGFLYCLLWQVLQDGTEHFCNPDVKMMFEYAQAFMNKDQEKLEELNQRYTVKQDVLYMIGQVTDSKELVKNIRLEEKEEGNMCEYLEEIRQNGWEDGEEAGREAGEKAGREAGEKVGREAGEKVGREAGEKMGEIRGKILGAIDFMRELQYGDSAIECRLMEKYQLSEEVVREYMCAAN